MPSPLEIITNAFRDLNLVGSGQNAPSAEDTAWGLNHYNRMTSMLAARDLGWYEVSELFQLTPSQQSYTIGPAGSGASFVMTAPGLRPPSFYRAKLVQTFASPASEWDIPIIIVQVYSSIPNPAQSSGIPVALYYQPTMPAGTLWLVPYPTITANGLRLFWRNQLGVVAMADINTQIDLPQGIEDALTWELFRRCLRGKPITEEQKISCHRSMQVLVTMKNADPVLIATDVAGANRRDYLTFNPNTLRGY